MKKSMLALGWVFVLGVWSAIAAPVGSVKGYVKDATGAVVPGASSVTLTSEDTRSG